MQRFKSLTLPALALAALTLSACNTTTVEGPIALSPYATQVFEDYQAEKRPKAMAVTTDGAYATYGYCRNIQCRNGFITDVISFCTVGRDEANATDAPCQLFAREDRIVWKGDVTLYSE
ncbi:MAG: hypothetical protein AAGF58_06090 [Pseudomonadota bacterium]